MELKLKMSTTPKEGQALREKKSERGRVRSPAWMDTSWESVLGS